MSTAIYPHAPEVYELLDGRFTVRRKYSDRFFEYLRADKWVPGSQCSKFKSRESAQRAAKKATPRS